MGHAFIWCSAGPIARQAEKLLRGQQPPVLNTVQPDSLNFLRWPLIAMFFGQIAYTIALMYGTDCDLFMPGGLNMVDCGAKYPNIRFLHVLAVRSPRCPRLRASSYGEEPKMRTW